MTLWSPKYHLTVHFTCSGQATTVNILPKFVTCWHLCIIFSLHDFTYFLYIFVDYSTTVEADGEVS